MLLNSWIPCLLKVNNEVLHFFLKPLPSFLCVGSQAWSDSAVSSATWSLAVNFVLRERGQKYPGEYILHGVRRGGSQEPSSQALSLFSPLKR